MNTQRKIVFVELKETRSIKQEEELIYCMVYFVTLDVGEIGQINSENKLSIISEEQPNQVRDLLKNNYLNSYTRMRRSNPPHSICVSI